MTSTATSPTLSSTRRGARASAPLTSISGRHDAPLLDVVIPVFNEEVALAAGVRRVEAFLRENLPFPCRVTIADNASTDDTEAIGRALAADLPDVRYLRLEEKGRGRALRTAWLASEATVVAYMDVDLSTDLAALLPLIAPLLAGHSELAIGTRLHRDARVVRGPKRELISRCYNRLLRTFLRVRFTDAQCGFKACRRDVAEALLPAVADQAWFFDTELLVLAERMGLRIHEVPVDWTDDPDSRVAVVDTAIKDLRGMWRIRSAQAQIASIAALPEPATTPTPVPSHSTLTSKAA